MHIVRSILLITSFFSIFKAGSSQTVDTTLWVPNGPVNAIEKIGNDLYIGGQFNDVGPYTGSFIRVDTINGSLVPSLPKVNGSINVIVSDSSGGWYIGGKFDRVGPFDINNLTHIFSNGQVDYNWKPNPDGEVRAILRQDSVVFVGGDFANIGGGQTRYAAKLDTLTGQISVYHDTISGTYSVWDPQPDTSVYTIALERYTAMLIDTLGDTTYISHDFVYLGGQFQMIGGFPRPFVAQLDDSLGVPLPSTCTCLWNIQIDGTVRSILMRGDSFLLAGDFNTVQGVQRNHFAITRGNGALCAMNPNPNGTVYAITLKGDTLILGGAFSQSSSQLRDRVAAYNIVTGALLNFNTTLNGTVRTLIAKDSVIYIGGDFTQAGGQPRKKIAALRFSTGSATAWNPHIDNSVNTMLFSGPNIIAGGNFISAGGQDRNNIAKLDLVSGTLTNWDPGANNAVFCFHRVNNLLYVGGAFTVFNSLTRKSIAGIDLSNGTTTSFSPGTDGLVKCIRSSAGNIFIGGYFSMAGNKSRNNLASINTVTGNATSWIPDANGTVNDIVISGKKIYVGGYFSSLRSYPRSRIGAIDSITGFPLTWDPGANNVVYSMKLFGNSIYCSGSFTSVGGNAADHLASIDTTNAFASEFAGGTNGFVKQLVLTNDTLFACGSFTTTGQQNCSGISEIKMPSGNIFNWDPQIDKEVRTVYPYGSLVFAGGDFSKVNGTQRPFLAKIGLLNTVAVNETIDPGNYSVAVFPNPSSKGFTFEVTSSQTHGTFLLQVFDLLGQELLSRTFLSGRFTLGGEELPKGIYIYSISLSGKRIGGGKIISQ